MDYLDLIQKSLCYMENNLTSDLSLDTLAKQAHMSPYYFHRVFLSFIGIPVMEHIRKRRLTLASHDLINTKTNIMDIALKYRFNSQDVFSRAFKRYYGITPGKYRNLNKRSALIISANAAEEGYIMLNTELSQKLILNNQDKKDCLELMSFIMKLSEKAHKHGLLSLEPEINESHTVFMRKALQFVIDGIEPAYIKTILLNYIYTGNYHGKELLERLLITEGILSIQAGENPLLIKEKLSSFFGEDFSFEIDIFFGIGLENLNEKILAYIYKIRNTTPISSLTSLLEMPFQKLDNRSLQRLIREIDIHDLLYALRGSSGIVQELILNCTSKKTASILVDELSILKQPVIIQIVDSQKKILETLSKLRTDKEIV